MQLNFRRLGAYSVSALGVAIAACADVPTQPAKLSAPAPKFAAASGTSCASPGAVVVSTEAQLRSAIAAAGAGDVVAISGTITVTGRDLGIDIPEGVTVTCAEPGAGLRVPALASRHTFFFAKAPNVTVSGLVFDAFRTSYAMVIQNGAGRNDVAGVSFAGNTVNCGSQGCLFIVGAVGTAVTGNVFEARHNSSGVHIQQGMNPVTREILRTDRTLVENNTITAIMPAGSGVFGAVRPRDGTDIVVRGNTIRGPWSNGLAMTEIVEALFERNSIEGATQGVFFTGSPVGTIAVRNSLFRGNDIRTTTGPALNIQRACANAFIANRLATPAAAPNVVFTTNTGANVILGPKVTVLDGGSYDCDGDGNTDPNSYHGQTHKGGYIGQTMSEVMPNAGRI